MTKKDFVALASAIRSVRETPTVSEDEGCLATADCIALAIAEVCAGSNDLFNENRFLRACGIGG
jgi:hypothetical protein